MVGTGLIASPPSAWLSAIVQGAIYTAALETADKPLDFQQLAVSHTAHDVLSWTFKGTWRYNAVGASLLSVILDIGIDQSSTDFEEAASIGNLAAERAAGKRACDGLAHFVDYVYGPEDPGVYQPTPDGNPAPDTPQATDLRTFGRPGDIVDFRAPPPNASAEDYEKLAVEVKEVGSLDSTQRTEYDTDTAYFRRESSVE